MKIVCCQLDIIWENKRANHERVRALLMAAPPEKNSLVILPELFATGFTMNIPAACEAEPSETEAFLSQLAHQYQIYLLGGLVSCGPDQRGRNEAVVFNPQGTLVARYHKMHPFSLGGETALYSAGSGLVSFDWEGIRVTPFICYDLRFPELFRRAVVKEGTQLFAGIANWPFPRDQHWITLLQARAIENQAYVAGVNRAGTDPRYRYPGRSLVADPQGRILVDAGSPEGLVTAEVHLEEVLAWRRDFPALRDMRADLQRE